jgi:hypothetical protein
MNPRHRLQPGPLNCIQEHLLTLAAAATALAFSLSMTVAVSLALAPVIVLPGFVPAA